MKISDMDKAERPRERMINEGAEALSNSELLAIILQKGYPPHSAVEVANRLLAKYGIEKLSELSVPELRAINGIGIVKALQIKALFELNKRHFQARKYQRIKRVKEPKHVYDLFIEQLSGKKKEHFYVLLLDSNNQVIGKDLVSIGTLNMSVIHPREVFQNAIKESANAIIIVHNHPSGNVNPSDEDREITDRLKEAGDVLGIKVLDHVIIGKNKYRSI
jgi:DNA repair protein RadC